MDQQLTEDLDLFASSANENALPTESSDSDSDKQAVVLAADAVGLLEHRNTKLGALFDSPRAVNYLTVLSAFVDFLDNHELEPLQEDLRVAVCGLSANDTTVAAFTQDMTQLTTWGLVTSRIEKERLHGYRDNRLKKFRYRLCDDGVEFVRWLRDRRDDDLHPQDVDASDLLDAMKSMLNETLRRMNVPPPEGEEAQTDQARFVLGRVIDLSRRTDEVARNLSALNLRLLAFATGDPNPETARTLMDELDLFLATFVRRLRPLRQEILPAVEKLLAKRLDGRWDLYEQVLKLSRAKMKHVFRTQVPDARKSLRTLQAFYGPGGEMQELMARVSDSAGAVWQRLSARLREIERRSHRLEDLRGRIRELAEQGEDFVPEEWLRSVFEFANARGDAHIDPEGKSIPPQPAWERGRLTAHEPVEITARAPDDGRPTRSLDEARLQDLRDWMRARGLETGADGKPVPLSGGRFVGFDDFPRAVALARSVLLGNGRRAAKIGVSATVGEPGAKIALGDDALGFEELFLTTKEVRT